MNEAIKPLRLKQERILKASAKPAEALVAPVAAILVDSGVLHLDQEFDFLVPHEMAEVITPGTLVKVPFRRKRVLGVVTARKNQSQFRGELRFISEVVRPFPLVSKNILTLCDEVRKYYGGTRWDVLRFALPTFSKQVQQMAPLSDAAITNQEQVVPKVSTVKSQVQSSYPASFWDALSHKPSQDKQIRAYWSPTAGADPFFMLAEFIKQSSRSALVVLPDFAEVERLWKKLLSEPNVGNRKIVKWHSQMPRAQRESTFLEVLNSEQIVILGVRGSLFLPVKNLDLILLWDEASVSHSEQRSPYFHSREVAIMRANIEMAHLIVAGYSPSIQCALYVERRYLRVLEESPRPNQARSISVVGIEDRNTPQESGRLSTKAWRIIRAGLLNGPVLVQVPIRGYIQSLACSFCRNRALCQCGGKLILPQAASSPECIICRAVIHGWVCPYCSRRELRNNQIGDLRVVEELGKSLPNQKILFSNRDHRLFTLENESVLVVATPGSEPIADLGYSAIAVVNSNLALERATLDADVDARNRWFALATLLRKNGTLFVDTETSHPTLQALIRWNPIGAAVNELEERKRLSLPPAVKTIEISGEYAAVSQIVRNLPDYVLVSNPQRNELGESAALIRIVNHQPLPVVKEIFGRVAAQSASGAPMARVKVDPVSI